MHEPQPLSASGRRIALTAAVLAWLCAGVQMGLVPLTTRPAVRDLLFAGASGKLDPTQEAIAGEWFGWNVGGFLLGGALGGLVFGWVGDRAGRVRALGLSVLCYSAFAGAGWLARDPDELLLCRFLSGLGVGGSWPAAVSLLAEAWPEASRPAVAGALGTAANVGILVMALVGQAVSVTPETWRAVALLGSAPALLGVWILLTVPESPRWLAERSAGTAPAVPLIEVLRPPLLGRTLVGIGLGAVPLVGAWASGKWMIPWADAEGAGAALTQAVWAAGAVLGGAAGGWLASLGRRTTYFLVCLGSLLINLTIYHLLTPLEASFLPAVFLLGLVATVLFGWLPLYLPELFPTRVRATGTGLCFNIGRVASAAGAIAGGGLMALLGGSYPSVGATTSWVYALGMVVILFAPDTRPRPASLPQAISLP